jgi:hypothetical protein
VDDRVMSPEDEFHATLRQLEASRRETGDDPPARERRRLEIERLQRRLDELAETVELA